MSLQFITGRSGSGKTCYIYDRILKEASENLKTQYLVIVPEQFTMSTQKQLVDMSKSGAILNVDVLSFNRLAYRIFSELGISEKKTLGDDGKNFIICNILKKYKDKLNILGSGADKSGYIDEIKSFISELMQYRITPDDLNDLEFEGERQKSLALKIYDISYVYSRYLDFINDGYVTGENLLKLLAEVIYKSEIIKDSII